MLIKSVSKYKINRMLTKKYILLILSLASGLLLLAQENSLRGNVFSDAGQAVEGVAITIEGSKGLAVTDSTGAFSIADVDQKWIKISPIGAYKGKRIFIDGEHDIKIYLSAKDRQSVHDEVSTGYGLATTNQLLSKLSKPSTDNDFYTKSAQDINVLMQGDVEGIYTRSYSGSPQGGSYSYLRGIRSMNGNNQPLYVIDGLIIEKSALVNSLLDGTNIDPLSTLEINDIVSVDVLRNAAATAIYGAKGSNGVIIIKTLKPTDTKTMINLSLQSGLNMQPSQYTQLDKVQYKTFAKEMLATSSSMEENFAVEYPGLYATEADGELYYPYQHNTNWQDEIYQNSMFSKAYLSITGGDEVGKYGVSVGYQNNSGIIKETGNDRLSLRFISDFSVLPKVNMFVSTNLSYSKSILKETSSAIETNPILAALAKNPLMGIYNYDADGNQISTYQDVDELGVSSPSVIIDGYSATNDNYRFNTSIAFEGEVMEHLDFGIKGGLNYNTVQEEIFQPDNGMEYYYGGEVYNASKASNNKLFVLSTDNYLKYNNIYDDKHELTAFAGFRLSQSTIENDWVVGKNLPSDEYQNIGDADATLTSSGGDKLTWQWLSYYTSASYAYKGKYLASLSGSIDGSSRIGKSYGKGLIIGDQPYGAFGAVGLGWRISNEQFLQDIYAIEDLKFRVSYGVTGNDDIGEYSSLDYYVTGQYRELLGLNKTTLANTEIGYEYNYEFNPGIDLALWGNRVALSLDYFHTVTKDAMIYANATSYSGYDVQAVNGLEMKNTGYEVSLNVRAVSTPKFKVDALFNISTYNNEVVSIKGDQLITEALGAEFITQSGSEVNSFYGYQMEKVFSTTAEAASAHEGTDYLYSNRGLPFEAGDVKYTDQNNDGIINDDDKVILGSPNPDLYGGFGLNFKYGGWSLNSLFNFALGGEAFNYVKYMNESMSSLNNQNISTLNRWQYEGHETEMPRAQMDDPVGNTDFSSRWVEDNSYLRLKRVELAYTITNSTSVFKNMTFSVSGENLLTFTNYTGADPEFSYMPTTMSQGLDYGATPQYKRVLFSVKLGL